jgi:hypothetical protein
MRESLTYILFLPALMAAAVIATPADAVSASGAAATTRPAYKTFRYDEDFSTLADPAQRTLPLDELKYLRLADHPRVTLTLGGEARTRYEYYGEPGFGRRGRAYDDFVLQRLLLHADCRVGDHLRLFAQTVSGWEAGSAFDPSATQDDVLDLQQGFADFIFGDPHGDRVTVRTGRMEMGFGSFRLVTPRDPTNARLNFDGLRTTLKFCDATVDAFLTRPVQQKRGVFNDGENDDQTFWGLYATTPVSGAALHIDVYYLGLRRENARFYTGVGTDERHSLGTRGWGTIGGFDYDVEGVYQFGDFAGDEIRAWTLASSVGYTWNDVAWKPRLGLKTNIASGDTDRDDGRSETFYALFPRQGYFSEINLLAPSNFFDIHPSLQFRPADRLLVTTSWDPFWKFSEHDAIYGPGRVAIPASASRGRYVGSTFDVQAEWSPTPQLTVAACYAHFFAGEAVTSAGGKSSDFFGTWITLKF